MTQDREPERIPLIVNSLSLENLARLVMLREMTVKEHLMYQARLLDMKYRKFSVESLAQMAKATIDR